MKEVTYNGPNDENDRSSYIRVAGEKFLNGETREVSNEVATAVKKVEGHSFTVSSGSSGSSSSDE